LTITGADNRGLLLKRTLEAIHPYFDEFHIFDNGSTDCTRDLKNEFSKLNYVIAEPKSLPDMVREAIKTIPKGDWFYYSDSDEAPSGICTPLLRGIPEREKGFEAFWFFGILHFLTGDSSDPTGRWQRDCSQKFHENPGMFVGSSAFSVPRFFKATNNLWVENTGTHFYIKVGNGSTTHPPMWNLTFNHIKTRATWDLSSVFWGMFNPEHHSVPKVAEWRCLMKETELTLRKIQEWVHTNQWPESIKEWIRKNRANTVVNSWGRIILDNTSLPQIETFHCGKICCKYGNRQF